MGTFESSPGMVDRSPARRPEPMVSIVIPAFNEAGRIGGSIEKIQAFLEKSPIDIQVIVVDDGSTDATPDIVQAANTEKVRLIRNDRNRGKGYSVRQGVLNATGKYVDFPMPICPRRSTS